MRTLVSIVALGLVAASAGAHDVRADAGANGKGANGNAAGRGNGNANGQGNANGNGGGNAGATGGAEAGPSGGADAANGVPAGGTDVPGGVTNVVPTVVPTVVPVGGADVAEGVPVVAADVSAAAAEDAADVQELVVYVGRRSADLRSVRSLCRAVTGLAAPDEECALPADDSADGGRALVYRMRHTSERAAKRGAARLLRHRDVSDVLVNSRRRTRGAPVQIPVIEGDLDPRVIREQPAMAQVRLDGFLPIANVRGFVVAVLDGGFDLRHECLEYRLGGTPWDALDDDADAQDLGNDLDDDADGTTDRIVGHGTFVASLVLAGAQDSLVLPVRVLDDEGFGSPLAVAKGIRYAVEHGAGVINMSLVVPTTTEMVRDAVQYALDAGVVVVSAAGNERTWQNDPNLARRVITVGAVNRAGDVASFSVTGPHVHVYAPGVGIRGALGGERPNDYATWRGTSFAAPFVSAAAAIMHQTRPEIAAPELRAAVMQTSVPISDLRAGGRGLLDAAAAHEAVR